MGKKSNEIKVQQTAFITTLGCKVNQYESAAFQTGFQEKGLLLVDFSRPADIYVINTCAVTAKAGAQSRQLIRRALRANPTARFIVTGCYAQVAAAEIRDIVGDHALIIGNNQKHLLVERSLAELDKKNHRADQYLLNTIREERDICSLPVRRFGKRTRAFLKVQDGCNNFCSYCIVPYARGRSRSELPSKIIQQAKTFDEEGYRELVITGIHVGDYGRDLRPATNLTDMVRKLLRATPDMRYRISSLEPTEITSELLQLIAKEDNLMPHLHIPLQSGDDSVLNKMNRRYKSSDFVRIVNMVHASLPSAAIGADVLVGFPGEGEQAFENTVALLEKLPVTYLHVFPYSKRPGTAAAEMGQHVAKKIKEERVARLRELDHKKRIVFYKSQLGKKLHVLAEKAGSRGIRRFKGFSENYIPVFFNAPPHAANRVVSVKLEGMEGTTVFGQMVHNDNSK
jgi:threonylcarbamoyladenosine tRNA methylthiotransferase MtaB